MRQTQTSHGYLLTIDNLPAMSHNAPKLSSDSMLILEQSLLKVPVEAMRKAHRLSSKAIDKDLTSLSTSLKRTRKLVDHDERLRQVEAAIVKMKGAKRKVGCLSNVVRARLG